MRLRPLGERAAILDSLDGLLPWQAARMIEATAPEWLEEAAPAFESVGLYLREGSAANLQGDLERILSEPLPEFEVRRHRLPVCYEMGEDREAVAEALGLTAEGVADLHASVTYVVRAIGFTPGFPYLDGLPDALCGVPRLGQPRLRVPAGSVGVTGRQSGIYPIEHPGGWMLIGRTPLTIADARTRYFPMAPGDEVRFEPIDPDTFAQMLGQRL